MENSISPENKFEYIPEKTVLLVEDNEMTADGFLLNWKRKNKERGINFIHCLSKNDALEKIKEIKEETNKLPRLIFIDGDLGKRERGENLIEELKELYPDDFAQIEIIAFSSDIKSNQKMEKAGATKSIAKLGREAHIETQKLLEETFWGK